MNTFNRFLVILLTLLGLLFWFGVVLLVWLFPRELSLILRDLAALFRTETLVMQGVTTAAAVSFILVDLLILLGEFSSEQPAVVELRTDGGTSVSLATIAQRLKDELEALPGVAMARANVRAAKNLVELRLEVRPERDAQLPAMAEEVHQRTRMVVENQLGVRLRDVRVVFHTANNAGREDTPPTTTRDIVVPGATARPQRMEEPKD